MISKLIQYVEGLPSKMFKSDAVDDAISMVYSDIRINLKPIVVTVGGLVKNNDVALSAIDFIRGSDVDREFRSVSRLVKQIGVVISVLENNKEDISDSISNMPKMLTTTGLTTNQALSINVIDNIRFFVNYTVDLLMMVIEHLNSVKESVYSLPIIRDKKKSLYDYYTILVKYADFSTVLVDLDNLVINKQTKMVETILSDRKVNVINRGFVGSPIYHIQLWMVDNDIRNIKILEKKKEYVELLLAELELKHSNSYDSEVETQIITAKEMINEYEDKIEKLAS